MDNVRASGLGNCGGFAKPVVEGAMENGDQTHFGIDVQKHNERAWGVV